MSMITHTHTNPRDTMTTWVVSRRTRDLSYLLVS